MVSWVLSLLAFVNSFLPQPTYREGILGQPQSLNPLEISSNQPDRDLARFIHRGLMKYDEKGNLIPDLAEHYKVSDDHKEYTFYLHRNLYWHDGGRFTTDDVIETISRQNLEVLEADKLDNFTVRFRLVKDPYVPLLDLLTGYLIPAAYKRGPQSGLNVTGLGDYRIARIKKSAKIQSVYLTLARPWQKNPNYFTRIIFNYYDTPTELEMAARLGEIDAFGSDKKVNVLPNFQSQGAAVASRYYALFFNLEKELFKEREVRNFLGSLVPRQEIVREELTEAGVSSYGPLEYTFALPRPTTPSAQPKLTLKKKIEQTLILTAPEFPSPNTNQTLLNIAERIKLAWQKAGLTVEIRRVAINSIFSEIIAKKDFEILLFGQEVERDPDVYTLWHSAQINLPGLNFSSYKSVLADRSLEEGRKSFSLEERLISYEHFLRVFNEDTPAIFLYHPLYTFSFRNNLEGPNLGGLFKISDRFVNFNKWREK